MKQFFVFPEHCAFCLSEILTRCHRYVTYLHKYVNKETNLDHKSTICWWLNKHKLNIYEHEDKNCIKVQHNVRK